MLQIIEHLGKLIPHSSFHLKEEKLQRLSRYISFRVYLSRCGIAVHYRLQTKMAQSKNCMSEPERHVMVIITGGTICMYVISTLSDSGCQLPAERSL